MDIKTSVDWINSVRDSYGDSIEAVMTAHCIANQNSAGAVFHNTATFGILSLDPEFLTDFAKEGGDVQYLEKATQTFLNVRSKVFGL